MPSTRTRSFTKALTWRVLSTAVTALIVWLFTGDIRVVASVMAADATVMTLLYYFHERIWKRVRWGKY